MLKNKQIIPLLQQTKHCNYGNDAYIINAQVKSVLQMKKLDTYNISQSSQCNVHKLLGYNTDKINVT